MRRLLFLVLLVVPAIEIALFILIGRSIGIVPTLLGVFVTAVLGALLLRAQGLPLLAEMREALAMGQLPARAFADAMMIGIAGLLLMMPGYFTDALGLLLLVPPVRARAYEALSGRLMAMAMGGARRPPGPGTIDLDSEHWRPR